MHGDKLHNWDFVGRCYNVLTVDPLKIDDSATFKMAFEFNEEDFEEIPDGSSLKPRHTDYVPATGGSLVSKTVSLSSAYDFRNFNKTAGSVEVSDPTGSLFSMSLSRSFSQTRDETESQSKVVTYTQQIIKSYRLSMRISPLLSLSKDLASAVADLPSSRSDQYRAFIEQFGTHYSHTVDFGGRGYQRMTIEESEYSTFREEGLNVEAEAKLTFDLAMAKAGGKLSSEDKRSDKFVRATKNSTDELVFTGGVPQQLSDMWAISVNDRPGPIRVELRPIYDLLTQYFLPEDPDIDAKQAALKEVVEEYLKSRGDDATKAVLHQGERVVLALSAGKSISCYLSAAQSKYVSTSLPSTLGDPGSEEPFVWILVHADDPARTGQIQSGDVVSLRSVTAGSYLDAQAGADKTYEKGDGLTAATATRTSEPQSRWKVVLADDRGRKEIIDGDLVRFESQWRDPDGQFGYLMSESVSLDGDQRVFAFGKKSIRRGSTWRIVRAAGTLRPIPPA